MILSRSRLVNLGKYMHNTLLLPLTAAVNNETRFPIL
jgi:hypothetical protein